MKNAVFDIRNFLQVALAAVMLSVWNPGTVLAETEIIESRSQGQNYSDYADSTFANSTLKSTAPGCTGGSGSRYGFTNQCIVWLAPSQLTNAGGVYLLEVTHGAANKISTNIMVNLAISGGIWTNETDQSTSIELWTDAFQKNYANSWKSVGKFVLSPGYLAPLIVCTTTNTDLDADTARFYSDAYRFSLVTDPCLTVPQLSTVNGPLYAGQTNVTVPNVSAAATKLSVYSYFNGAYALLGTKTSNIVAGLNTVPLFPGTNLEKDLTIVVTQWTNNVESCKSLTGPIVGGGANPRIRISLSFWENPTLAGPIGASAGTPPPGSTLKYLGATNTFGGGFDNAPLGGKVFEPSTNWQTVSFWRDDPDAPDPVWGWSGDIGSTNLYGQFAVLESLAFAMDDISDTGPFVVYLDSFMNGTNLIEGFEGAGNGQPEYFLRAPSYSGTTSSSLLSQAPGSVSPNLCRVTNGIAADTGAKCAVVSWQWSGVSPSYWLRLVAAGNGAPYPQIDLTQPVSFRLLLLPLGVSPPPPPLSPVIQWSCSGTALTLNWTTGTLQSSPVVSGPYSDVPEAVAPYAVPQTVKSIFFRLR